MKKTKNIHKKYNNHPMFPLLGPLQRRDPGVSLCLLATEAMLGICVSWMIEFTSLVGGLVIDTNFKSSRFQRIVLIRCPLRGEGVVVLFGFPNIRNRYCPHIKAEPKPPHINARRLTMEILDSSKKYNSIATIYYKVMISLEL